jgi:hypothetical protein
MNSLAKAQPTLNQRFAATEREQTGLNVTLFVNVFGVSLRTLAAHNGLLAGSSPAGPRQRKLIVYRVFLRTTAPEAPRESPECIFSAHEESECTHHPYREAGAGGGGKRLYQRSVDPSSAAAGRKVEKFWAAAVVKVAKLFG